MFRIAALNDTCGSEDDTEKIKLTKTKEAKEAEAFAVYNKALSYQQKGHSVHAEKLLKNLLVEHPLLQEASDLVEDDKQVSIATHRGLQLLYSVHKNMASIYLHRNELESAIKSYIEAVRIDPSEVTVWFKMGQIALKLDKLALGKICFQQALECNAKHWPSLDQAITLTFALGDYLMCLEYISTALENDSSYLKGLALRKQIFTEQPSLDRMTSHLFENCDSEINRVRITKEEIKEFMDEAAKIRSKARQLVNDFHEEQNKPVAFLEPLTPFTWKNMGDQLIKLYDFAINNQSPKSLGQEVDLRDYFFLDPTLFLGQDTSDETANSPTKEMKSASEKLNASTLEAATSKQPITPTAAKSDKTAFQRASNQTIEQSTAILDVLGIQDDGKESALLKRLQGRMVSSSSSPTSSPSSPMGVKKKIGLLTPVNPNGEEEEAMEVADSGQAGDKPDGDGGDKFGDSIEDIDMPLLDEVELDINLTDIQKIDLKPELLLKDDDVDDLANLVDVKSLDNVLSSVIDMEYEQEERDSGGKVEARRIVEERLEKEQEQLSVAKRLSFSDDKPQVAESNTLEADKNAKESSLRASNNKADLSLQSLSTTIVTEASPLPQHPSSQNDSQTPKQSETASPSQTKDKQDKDSVPSNKFLQLENSPADESKDSLLTSRDRSVSDKTMTPGSLESELEKELPDLKKSLASKQELRSDVPTKQMELSGDQGKAKALEGSQISKGDTSTLKQGETALKHENDVTNVESIEISQVRDTPLKTETLLTEKDRLGTGILAGPYSNELKIQDLHSSQLKLSISLKTTDCSQDKTLGGPVTKSTPMGGVEEGKAGGPELKSPTSQQTIPTTGLELTHQECSKPGESIEDDVEMKPDLQAASSLSIHSKDTRGDIEMKCQDESESPIPVLSSPQKNSPAVSSSLKNFSISSLISLSPSPSDSASPTTHEIDTTGTSETSTTMNIVLEDSAPKPALPSADSNVTASISLSSVSQSPFEARTEVIPSSSQKSSPPNVQTSRISTRGLIEDVIRSELNLDGKPMACLFPAPPTPSSSSPSMKKPSQHTSSNVNEEHSDMIKSSTAPLTLSLHQRQGVSPSHAITNTTTTTVNLKQSPQKTRIISPGSSSSPSKTQKTSSPSHTLPVLPLSSPYSSLLQHHRHPLLPPDPFLNPLPHHSLAPTPPLTSDRLHQTLNKELAFLNLPMHYINSISALEAEAILKASTSSSLPSSSSAASSSSSDQQHLTNIMRDLLLRQQQQQPSSLSSLPLGYTSHHHRQNPRHLFRSLSSPGYFSDKRHPDLPLSPLSHHPLLSPPIHPPHSTKLPQSSQSPSTFLLPEFHAPSHLDSSRLHLHQTIPSPYPLLSHHHDYATPYPYPNLYPPLSPRSKYPLIPSTSPSYLRSRLHPHLPLPYDTTSTNLLNHHHLPLHLPPNWPTSTTSSETELPQPLLPHRPKSATSSSLPVRKALFTSTTTAKGHEGHSTPPTKSQKLSSSHRSASSASMDPNKTATAISSRHDQFQKMIEQMLESTPQPASAILANPTTKSTTGHASQSSLKGSSHSKSRHRSPAISRQQRAPKRKADDLGTIEWAEVFRGGRSTRSRSNRGKKEEPVMDITKLLLTHFPPSLLELSEVRDVFLGGDDNKDSSKAQDLKSLEVDLSKIACLADGETEDVKGFLKKCLKGNGILDLIFKYLLHLAGRVDCVWSENLTETFMFVYKRLRKHISAPSTFDNFDGFTPEALKKYTQVMLTHCEFVLDAVRVSHTDKAVLMSPSAGGGSGGGGAGFGPGADLNNVQGQLGEFYEEDMTFLSAITRYEEAIGSNHLDYCVRIYWLKAKHHNLYSQTLDAIDCFQTVSELIGEMTDSSKVIILPNLREDRIISQQEVEAQVDALQRCKSLENTRSLFDKGDYSSVVDSLLQTFDKKSVKESKERPSQLLLLQDSLERLDRKKECLRWAEISVQEALTQFKTVKTSALKLTWSSTLASLFVVMDRLLSDDITIVASLGSDRLTRLSHNLVSIIKTTLDVGRTTPSEMPINSLLPWILLYKILKYEESKTEERSKAGEDAGKSKVADVSTGKDEDEDGDDEEEDSDLKPSIKMLIQAHDHLGRHSWCTKEDGVLLFFLMGELQPLMEELEEDDDDREICVHAFEQCLLCLYNHPNKRGKAKHLQDHQAKPITLTWERAVPVFHYFTRAITPEFDSKKTSSIAIDVEHLLRRIYILVPSGISPNSFTDAVTSYIDGTASDVHVPASLHQSVTASGSLGDDDDGEDKNEEGEEKVQKRLYYLLADFYMKNSELKKAVKFYQLDLLLNTTRMDSWAGLALAKMSRIEQELSSIDLRLDAPAPRKWDGAMRCFQRAVECDGKNRKLWVEFGLLAYQLHSHASQQARVFGSNPATATTHQDFVKTALERRHKYLQSALTSFRHALECKCDGDGSKDDWLIHYMLGKVAEKQTPDKPTLFLHHYTKAAECLHLEKALYPEKVQFATTPPHLALEALEVFYRGHASVLKLLMHDGIADGDLPQVYTASVKSLTGKFARCVKHKGTSNEAEREEKSLSASVSGQNLTTSSKGKKSGQPKSAISDHSYSKERKVSSSGQAASDKVNIMTEKRQRETQKADGGRDSSTATAASSKSKDCTLSLCERVEKTAKSQDADSASKIDLDGNKKIEAEKVKSASGIEDSGEANLSCKERDEKPEFVQSQSSQGSERSFLSDNDAVFESTSQMEVADSSSQISMISNVSGMSRVDDSAAEEQEVTATSSQQSTQGSVDVEEHGVLTLQQNSSREGVLGGVQEEGVKSGKDGEGESDRESRRSGETESVREIEEMEVDTTGDGIGKVGVVDGGSSSNGGGGNSSGSGGGGLDKKTLQKQASEGFTPRMLVSSQGSDGDAKVDDGEDVVEKGEEEGKEKVGVDCPTSASESCKMLEKVEVGEKPDGNEEKSVEKDAEDVALVKDNKTAIDELKEAAKEEGKIGGEGDGAEKWEKEDQEKSSVVRKDATSALSQAMDESVLKDETDKDAISSPTGGELDTQKGGKKVGGDSDDVKIEKGNKDKKSFDADDDVIMLDPPTEEIPKTIHAADAPQSKEMMEKERESEKKIDVVDLIDDNKGDDDKKDADKKGDKNDDSGAGLIKESVMEVDEDYVVIPPNVSMIKAELIQNCIRGVEIAASRFSSHYKSLYRLAHFYFHSEEHKNVELARDLLLGRPDWSERPGMPNPGLFGDRKGNNFFQGLWKIPIDDIDRPGSFASHVLRSVRLLLDVLDTLEDLEMLNHVRNQMKRTPDAGKKYLRDWDRQLLVDEAFSHMLEVVDRRMAGGAPWQWAEDQREEHLAHVYCVWRWGKGCGHMTRATALLHQAFRVMMKGRTDVNRLTAEQAILYCQQNLSKATIQSNPNVTASLTNSPAVKPVSQSTMKKPTTMTMTPVTSGSSPDVEKSKTTTATDTVSVSLSQSQVRNVTQHKSPECVKGLVKTPQPTQQEIVYISPSSSSSSSSSTPVALSVPSTMISVLSSPSTTTTATTTSTTKPSASPSTTTTTTTTSTTKPPSSPSTTTTATTASTTKPSSTSSSAEKSGISINKSKQQDDDTVVIVPASPPKDTETGKKHSDSNTKKIDFDEPDGLKTSGHQSHATLVSAMGESKTLDGNLEIRAVDSLTRKEEKVEKSVKTIEVAGGEIKASREGGEMGGSGKEDGGRKWGNVFSEYVQKHIGQGLASGPVKDGRTLNTTKVSESSDSVTTHTTKGIGGSVTTKGTVGSGTGTAYTTKGADGSGTSYTSKSIGGSSITKGTGGSGTMKGNGGEKLTAGHETGKSSSSNSNGSSSSSSSSKGGKSKSWENAFSDFVQKQVVDLKEDKRVKERRKVDDDDDVIFGGGQKRMKIDKEGEEGVRKESAPVATTAVDDDDDVIVISDAE